MPENIIIPGTRPDPKHSLLKVSTGVPTIDKILGGGLPVGTLTIIEEDEYNMYAKTLLKYFTVEAVVSHQNTLTVALHTDPKDILKTLPALSDNQPKPSRSHTSADEQMKIAFRYQNLPTTQQEEQSIFGHYFDLSSNIAYDKFDKSSNHTISNDDIDKLYQENPTRFPFKNRNLVAILNKIRDLLDDVKYTNDDQLEKKNILRICIHHFGSIMWGDLGKELPKFMYYLFCLLQEHYAIAMVSVPTGLSPQLKELFEECIAISDCTLRLSSFAGTQYERNKALAEYHGFFVVEKMAAINALKSPYEFVGDLVFKQLRKKFCVEVLHLPAGVDLGPREQHVARGCGSSGGHGSHLDF